MIFGIWNIIPLETILWMVVLILSLKQKFCRVDELTCLEAGVQEWRGCVLTPFPIWEGVGICRRNIFSDHLPPSSLQNISLFPAYRFFCDALCNLLLNLLKNSFTDTNKINLIRIYVPENIDTYLIHMTIKILEKDGDHRMRCHSSCDPNKKRRFPDPEESSSNSKRTKEEVDTETKVLIIRRIFIYCQCSISIS